MIPILLDGTRLPRAESLPEDLRELPMRNALDVRHASFHHDMDKLIRTLRGMRLVLAPRTTHLPDAANAGHRRRRLRSTGRPTL